MIYTAEYLSPAGRILLAEKSGVLAGRCFEGQRFVPDLQGKEYQAAKERPVLLEAQAWLDRYFRGERPRAGELRLTLEGTEFRLRVWRLLCEIPYGTVVTYGEIAERLGAGARASRAVGGAVGHNPISIVIPCHRVVGADGGLTGYAGGIRRKRWLLAHEGLYSAAVCDKT